MMIMLKKKLYVLIFLIVPITLAAVDYDFLIVQADIDAGLTVSQSGVWRLNESVTFNSAAAITVSANNVTLDLFDNTIDGQSTGSVAIVIDNVAQTIVQNGVIKDTTSNAVQVNTSTDSLITGITINACSGSGVALINSQFTDIINCRITDSAAPGISVDNTSGNTALESCTTTSCSDAGYVMSGDNYIIHSCFAAGTNNTGIGFNLIGNNAEITQSYAVMNNADGFFIVGNNVNIELSVASANKGNGICVASDVTGGDLRQNIIVDNAGYGIKSSSLCAVKVEGSKFSNNTLGNLFRVRDIYAQDIPPQPTI